MRKLGIPEQVARLRDQYQKEAYAHLDAVEVEDARKVPLRLLTEGLLQRDFLENYFPVPPVLFNRCVL